jgi:hypothetical protein
MNQELPSPDQADESKSSQSQHSRRQRKGPRIPTRDEILQMLSQLNGMVMMGLISTPKARVIQQNLQIQLKAQTQRPEADQCEVSMEGLGEALKRDPELIKLLEGFLSDEQVEWLLRQNTDAPD